MNSLTWKRGKHIPEKWFLGKHFPLSWSFPRNKRTPSLVAAEFYCTAACHEFSCLTYILQEEEEREEEEQSRSKESGVSRVDVALQEMTLPTAEEAQKQAMTRTLEKHEHLCKISRALAVLASASVRIRAWNAVICVLNHCFRQSSQFMTAIGFLSSVNSCSQWVGSVRSSCSSSIKRYGFILP